QAGPPEDRRFSIASYRYIGSTVAQERISLFMRPGDGGGREAGASFGGWIRLILFRLGARFGIRSAQTPFSLGWVNRRSRHTSCIYGPKAPVMLVTLRSPRRYPKL